MGKSFYRYFESHEDIIFSDGSISESENIPTEEQLEAYLLSASQFCNKHEYSGLKAFEIKGLGNLSQIWTCKTGMHSIFSTFVNLFRRTIEFISAV